MIEIDPRRTDLAREFRARPLGVHSADLQAVLNRMRSEAPRGKYLLYMTKPHAEWVLARLAGEPLRPEVVPGYVFRTLEEAEWAVFRLRWAALTGQELRLEGDGPLPPVPPLGEGEPLPREPAILAYTDQASVAPGETLGVKVSCHGVATYRADLVRLLAPETGPDEPGLREEVVPAPVNREYPGRAQPLHPGSFAVVPASPHFADLESVTLQAFVWPTRPRRGRQALLGTWSEVTRTGIGLGLDERGALALRLGDGGAGAEVSTGVALAERKWYFVGASYDHPSRTVRLWQEPVADWALDAHGPVHVAREVRVAPRPGPGPFLFAAWHRGEARGQVLAGGHFDGKLDRPRLARRALGRAEMAALVDGPPPAGLGPAVVGAWDLAADIASERITDRSPHRLHGETVNLPTRAVTGHNWSGEEPSWRRAPEQYGAIHFHADDLADAGWEDDFTLTVPAGTRSGVYAARLRGVGAEAAAYAVFFVRPPRGRPAADRPTIAFLASTATYTVYCNNRTRFVATWTEPVHGRLTVMDATDLQLLDHGLGLSTYCTHADGSGVCYGTRLRPATNIRPTGRLWNFCADLFVVDWLERTGLGYDVVTDDDLHREGVELLGPYRVVVTGTHPEYETREMLDALDAHLRRGGRLMYLGGNGFYWRIAYHPTQPGIIEVRRSEDGTRAWAAEPGEYYMSFTGEYGGLWRRQRRAPNLLTGVGFISQGFDASTYYRRRPESRDPRVAWMFEGIGADELIGNFGTQRGGAAGLEIDSYDRLLGSPAHALVVASSENHSNAFQLVNESVLVAHGATDGPQSPEIRADMVFFECPGGGAVFSTGSIAYGGSLPTRGYDNNVARLTTNVLRRFADPAPFVMPP